MPSTPIFLLPYPILTDAPNGPAQIQALANATETALSGLVTRLPFVVEGFSSSDLTLGTAAADIPGATVSFSLTSSTTILIQANYDVTTTTTSTGFNIHTVIINGVAHARSTASRAVGVSGSPDRRGAVVQIRTTLGSGNHVIKLQSNKQINDGAISVGGALEVSIYK